SPNYNNRESMSNSIQESTTPETNKETESKTNNMPGKEYEEAINMITSELKELEEFTHVTIKKNYQVRESYLLYEYHQRNNLIKQLIPFQIYKLEGFDNVGTIEEISFEKDSFRSESLMDEIFSLTSYPSKKETIVITPQNFREIISSIFSLKPNEKEKIQFADDTFYI